jgi:hypothetical protein
MYATSGTGSKLVLGAVLAEHGGSSHKVIEAAVKLNIRC